MAALSNRYPYLREKKRENQIFKHCVGKVCDFLWQLLEPFSKLKKKWGRLWRNRLWIILTSSPANKDGTGWAALDRECRLHCGDVISGRGSGFIRSCRKNQEVVFSLPTEIFSNCGVLDVVCDGRHLGRGRWRALPSSFQGALLCPSSRRVWLFIMLYLWQGQPTWGVLCFERAADSMTSNCCRIG